MASNPPPLPTVDNHQETSTANAPQDTSITNILQNAQPEKPIKIAILDLDNCLFDLRTGDIAEGMKKILKEGGYTHYVFCTARSTRYIFRPHYGHRSWLEAQVKISQSLDFTVENIQEKVKALLPDCEYLGTSTPDDFCPLSDGSTLGFGQGYARVMQPYEKELKISSIVEKIETTSIVSNTDTLNDSMESDKDTIKKEVFLSNFDELLKRMESQDIPSQDNFSIRIYNYFDICEEGKRDEFLQYYFNTKNTQLSMIASMIEERFPGKAVFVDFYDDDVEKNLHPAIKALNLNTISPTGIIKEFNCWYFNAFAHATDGKAPEKKGFYKYQYNANKLHTTKTCVSRGLF